MTTPASSPAGSAADVARQVSQAIAQHASAVITVGFTTAEITAPLQQAHSAGIPVVQLFVTDPGAPPAGAGVFAYVSPCYSCIGATMADIVIHDSGGGADAVFVNAPDVGIATRAHRAVGYPDPQPGSPQPWRGSASSCPRIGRSRRSPSQTGRYSPSPEPSTAWRSSDRGCSSWTNPPRFCPKTGSNGCVGHPDRRPPQCGGAAGHPQHPPALDITERITALRDGHRVLEEPTTALTTQRLVTAMVTDPAISRARRPRSRSREVALRVRDLGGEAIREVSFDVRAGEIVGLTGLLGSGFQHIPYLLFGATPARSGSVRVHGTPLPRLTPARDPGRAVPDTRRPDPAGRRAGRPSRRQHHSG